MRIALDGMGGDHAPSEIIAGVLLATERGIVRPAQIVLVGRPEVLTAGLGERGVPFHLLSSPRDEFPAEDSGEIQVVPASEVVEMGESPALALRGKRDSSLAVGIRLVKEGRTQALVSAGNTGAVVAGAMMRLKSLEGVHRPGIAVVIEGEDGPFTVVDVGANLVPRPTHLLHYGVMGATLLRETCGKDSPRVGLLNIGGEEGKGHGLAKEVQELFRKSPLNYLGNIEGQDVFLGVCDVIVTEGFVGNVLLKLSEGLATHLLHVVQEELVRAGVHQDVLKESLAAIVRRTDYSEYGGALLLGVEGIVTICHGRSRGRAIMNAIRVSVEAFKCGVNQKIVAAIKDSEG